jgi:hypothetical protein
MAKFVPSTVAVVHKVDRNVKYIFTFSVDMPDLVHMYFTYQPDVLTVGSVKERTIHATQHPSLCRAFLFCLVLGGPKRGMTCLLSSENYNYKLQ